MAVRYVDGATGSDLNDGLTRATAWATIQHASILSAPGWIIKIAATVVYTEQVTVANSGLASGFGFRYDPLFWISYEADEFYPGDPVIDGTGFRSCIGCHGKSYLRFANLAVTNAGGDGINDAVVGIELSNGPLFGGANSVGSSYIDVHGCGFANVDRNGTVPSYGAPLLIYSQADDRLNANAATRYISVRDCTFDDSLLSTATIGHSHVTFAGNVHDFEVVGCTFNNVVAANVNQFVNFSTFKGGIEFGGNQLPSSFPDQQRKGVIASNTFNGVQPNGGYAVYPTGTEDILIERNYLDGWTYGFAAVCERGDLAGNPCTRIWIRDNVVDEPYYSSLNIGAFQQPADNYDDVSDVWATHNTLYRSGAAPMAGFFHIYLIANNTGGAAHGTLGITGDSKISDNVVVYDGANLMLSTLPAPAADLLNRNLWSSDVALPFHVTPAQTAVAFPYAVDQDVDGHFQTSATPIFEAGVGRDAFHLLASSWAVGHGLDALPSWYATGLFGAYEPPYQRDFYGLRMALGIDDVGAAQTRQAPIGTLQQIADDKYQIRDVVLAGEDAITIGLPGSGADIELPGCRWQEYDGVTFVEAIQIRWWSTSAPTDVTQIVTTKTEPPFLARLENVGLGATPSIEIDVRFH